VWGVLLIREGGGEAKNNRETDRNRKKGRKHAKRRKESTAQTFKKKLQKTKGEKGTQGSPKRSRAQQKTVTLKVRMGKAPEERTLGQDQLKRANS